jgi:hypothetical protein
MSKTTTQIASKPVAQQTAKPNAKTAPAIVVFGKDEEGKARAARFRPEEAEKAIKAAASMKMRVLKVTSEEADTVAGQLPLGRIYASGIGFVPPVQEVYLQRLEELAEPKAAPGLPKNWDAIDVGHLVVAQDPDDDAWYPAIVTAKDKDMVTLRFRDWPAQAPVTRHRFSVALLKPSV